MEKFFKSLKNCFPIFVFTFCVLCSRSRFVCGLHHVIFLFLGTLFCYCYCLAYILASHCNRSLLLFALPEKEKSDVMSIRMQCAAERKYCAEVLGQLRSLEET